ncbi:MAG: hypothetical protein FJ298_05090 [Planctomycetes bacterium]|nr:hypothetical protein [Planctomycetota bacterium]
MRNRAAIALLAVSVLASTLAYLLVLRPSTGGADGAARAADTATEAVTDDDSLAGAEGELRASAAHGAGDGRVEQELRPETAVIELTGRVLWPVGTPPDESAEVLLVTEAARRGDELRDGNDDELASDARILARATVEQDGSFRLPWRDRADGTWIELRGRYVFLVEPRRFAPADAGAALELAPELGAWVTGRVVVASGVAPEGFDVRECELELMFDALALAGGARAPVGLRAPKTHPRSDGSYEFRGVASRLARDLRARCDALAAFKSESVDVRPGLHVVLDAVLTRGGELAGRVVDADGVPIAEAKLKASVDPLVFGQGGFEVREGASDAEGRFVLAAVLAGEVNLDLGGQAVLERTLACTVRDGERTELGDVVLKRGATLGGVVRWPDGSPAANAKVRADFDPAALGGMSALNAMQGARGTAVADSDGHFTIVGLGKGPFLVSASAAPAPGASEHRASEGGVTPDGRTIELLLAAPIALDVRVVDAHGVAVPQAKVRAKENVGGVVRGLGGRTELAREKPESGHFRFEELGRGKWDLTATAEGFTRADRTVELASEPATDEVVLVLERGGAVSGRVVDVAGSPVEGASVQIAANLQNVVRQAEDGATAALVATSLPDGSFRLSNLSAGQHDLVARAELTAGSEAVEVEVRSGEETTGVLLTLRLGGTLTGEVYAKDGTRASGAQVLLQLSTDPLSQRFVNADRDGQFRVEHLAAGTYNVMHFPRANAKSRADTEGEADAAALLTGMLLASAKVIEGETVHVVLGAPAKDAVELAGRVTCDGRGVGGVMISLVRDQRAAAGAAPGSFKFATSGEDGRFTVTLDAPGDYFASLQKPGNAGQQQTVTQRFRAPETPTFQHEFELPIGAIAGRVRASDGSGAARVRVTLTNDGPMPLGSLFGDNYAEVETDGEGRYELVWLSPGRYTVAIGGAPLGGLLGGSARGGRALREGVAVREGARTEGVDFELHEAGSVSGIVKGPDGAPAADAALFVRDAAGRPVERLSMLATDSAGRFTYDGLESGEYTLSARKSGLASDGRARVLVRAGEAANVELVLGAGTLLLVTVSNEDGSPVEATLSVLDDAGREVHDSVSIAEIMEAMTSGAWSSREQRVGPLAPGKYRVIVTAPDGRKETKPVTLSGQRERKLNVRL